MKPSLIALLIFISIKASSQQETTLDPVTITATLNPSPASKTGRNIVTVTGEMFNKLPVHSLDDLLRYLPGIEVQQRGPAGSQSDIVLRGGTFQQVLVIIDGLRINDPNSGHFTSYIPIAPAEIERIEILKGASSAIYGSEAVGGVINIITKSFAARKNQQNKQFNISATGGEYDFFSANAGGSWQKNNTALSGGFLTNNSDGQPQRGTRGYFNNHTASLSVKQFINDNWAVSFRSAFDQRDFSAQNFYTTFTSDTAKEKVTSYWNQARVSFQKGKHSVKLDVGYKTVKDNYQYNSISTANNNHSNLLQLLLTEHFKLNDQTSFVSGLQFQNKKITSNDRGDHNRDYTAAFFILDQKIQDFTISPSIRIDHNDTRGTEFIPQLNLSYRFDKWLIRASGGKTIRDADFTEQYNNYNKSFVASGRIGNPDLVAERSFSYEAGADLFINKELKIAITGFQRRQKQLIDWIQTSYADMPRKDNLSPTGNYLLSKNISSVTTSGFETDIQYLKKFKNDLQLISSLGFVWLESRSASSTPSFYLSSHAKYLSNFYAEILKKKFSLSITAIYKNRTEQDAPNINSHVDANCFMMNLNAGYYLSAQRLKIFLQVDNIFDNACADLLGTQTPGRWLMGGINFSF